MIRAFFGAIGNLFKAPATYKYPFEESPVAKEYRGLIEYNKEKCIFCLKCEDVCPPGSILFDTDVPSGDQTYYYNPYLCIYCGECVRACPEPGHDGALWQEETLIPPADDSTTNDAWFELEKRVVENREAHKEKKKQDKLKKQQEAAAAKAVEKSE